MFYVQTRAREMLISDLQSFDADKNKKNSKNLEPQISQITKPNKGKSLFNTNRVIIILQNSLIPFKCNKTKDKYMND